jgi:hypothetical protein
MLPSCQRIALIMSTNCTHYINILKKKYINKTFIYDIIIDMSKLNDTNCTPVQEYVPEDSIIIDSQCSHCRDKTCFSFNISEEEDVTDSSSDVTVVVKDIPEGEQIDTENDSENDFEDFYEDRIKSYRFIDEVITEEDITRFSNLNINDDY